MSHYLCRLLDASGQVQGVVPIVGSSEADALETARSIFRILGGQGGFELWQDKVRIVAHGEIDADAKLPKHNPDAGGR